MQIRAFHVPVGSASELLKLLLLGPQLIISSSLGRTETLNFAWQWKPPS